MLSLAREIAMFQPTIEAVVHGDPEAILFVEFAEADNNETFRRLLRLGELLGDLGIHWSHKGAKCGGLVEVLDPKLQTAINEMRTAGLNIMMSMKEEGKPVSFVEDCAVPLEHLAEYTAKLTAIFEKHGTRGTWYAHASVGCLHVRPVLNLRLEKDVRAMRAIAEEAFELVRGYRGSHSGEHGDGIVRSEFHEKMFGAPLVRAFEQVKDRFDPNGRYNPGKIVRAPKFDDRRVFRYGPDYRAEEISAQLDWSAYPGAGGGFQGAVEMCNNNGACRVLAGGVMCPSYRVTRDERDVTRGRANTLRLAITGQLGPDALTSDEMAETMKLCVSCKACRRECPTGVDMARMKIEVQAARIAKHGLTPRDRLIGYLPRYAPYVAKSPGLANKLASLRKDIPRLRGWSEQYAGLSAKRSLPQWRRAWQEPARRIGTPDARTVAFFADTFNRYFEPENIKAALDVLTAAGLSVELPKPGRTAGRCAAAARFSRSGWSTRRARRRSVASRRSRRSSGGEFRSSGSSRAASSASATRSRRWSRARTRGCWRRTHSCSRSFWRARRRRARSNSRSSRWPSARCCTATATRNPSARCRRSRRRSSWCPTSRSRPWRRAAAAWPARSATAPKPSTSRSRWRSCRYCRRCARPSPIR